MNITPNVSLSNYSTMRLGGIADYLVEIHSRDDLVEAITWANERGLLTIMIGGGSNVIWRESGFQGLVMVDKILKYEDLVVGGGEHRLNIGSGEPWDSVVARSVAAGLTGIEALSLIPGSAGATPIQNVGAYGQDVSQTLESVEAYDTETGAFVTIAAHDCDFSYRNSRFKARDRGRYYIVELHFRLHVGNPLPPFYGAVQAYLEANPTDQPITPAVLRGAVIAIRSAKLPDPEQVANNGSFFANPIVGHDQLQKLLEQHPEMPHWPLETGEAKLPAAWLLEQAGFKDYHDAATGMATWPHQPLVLVNEHAHSTGDLLAFKEKLVAAVAERFGVTLIQEPEILP